MNSVEMTVTHSGADLSIMGLFWAADPFVKLVMLLLVLASVWCWAIVVEKITIIRRERRLAQAFENSFWSGGSLDKLYDETGAAPHDAMSIVFVAAMREWRRATAHGLADTGRADLRASLVSRIDRSMNFTITREMERMERGMNFLASIGRFSVCRVAGHGLGNYEFVPVDC